MNMLCHGFVNKIGKYSSQSVSRLASEDDSEGVYP